MTHTQTYACAIQLRSYACLHGFMRAQPCSVHKPYPHVRERLCVCVCVSSQMDGELERYYKTNSGLDLMISNLRLKQSGLQSEVLSQRQGKSDAESLVRRLQHDLTTVVSVIQEPKALKERVKSLYHKYCTESSLRGDEQSGDLEREAARQREYLEKTVDSLKRKLAKDSELHRTDNLRVMQVRADFACTCVCVYVCVCVLMLYVCR